MLRYKSGTERNSRYVWKSDNESVSVAELVRNCVVLQGRTAGDVCNKQDSITIDIFKDNGLCLWVLMAYCTFLMKFSRYSLFIMTILSTLTADSLLLIICIL